MKIGMEHNPDVTDDQDVGEYMKRDLLKRKEPAYKIIRDEIVGRHMVASRNIKAGEVIMKERPLTFGPSEVTKPICLGCYKSVTASSPGCGNCGYPMCSNRCAASKIHKENECSVFTAKGHKIKRSDLNFTEGDAPGVDPAYAIISPIRTLMIRRKQPDLWPLIWMQMSHLGKRRESAYWKDRSKKVMEAVKSAIDLAEDEHAVIEAILGIHLVNDFEIGMRDFTAEADSGLEVSIRGLFGLASMPNHDCVSNTTHDFSTAEDGFVMTVKALRPIKSGEDITHSYTEPLDSIITRQSSVSLGKFFICACKRCSDPTELGTFSSALKCPKCEKGNVVTANPADPESVWSCLKCKESITQEKVAKVTKAVKEACDKLDAAEPSIKAFEAFLKKYSTVVHENHVFLVDKKYTLAKMYGRMSGFEAGEMTDEQFGRKRKLCEDVLSVLDKIMPGRSRKRGMMKYELHLPLVMMTNRSLEKGPACGVSPEKLKADLKAGLQNLEESLDILGDEPAGSFESKIVEGSKPSVEQLRNWVKTVCASI